MAVVQLAGQAASLACNCRRADDNSFEADSPGIRSGCRHGTCIEATVEGDGVMELEAQTVSE